MESTH